MTMTLQKKEGFIRSPWICADGRNSYTSGPACGVWRGEQSRVAATKRLITNDPLGLLGLLIIIVREGKKLTIEIDDSSDSHYYCVFERCNVRVMQIHARSRTALTQHTAVL